MPETQSPNFKRRNAGGSRLLLSNQTQQSVETQELLFATCAIMVAILFGTIGYMTIEGWNAFDSLYMTVITLATIGYGETHPLSDSGRAFTIVLIFVGVGIVTVVIGYVWRVIITQQFNRVFDRSRKMRELIDSVQGHTIFCGFSRMGSVAAQELVERGISVVVIEQDERRAEEAQSLGLLVVIGDATLDETLTAAGIQRASRLVSLLPKDSDNLYVILTAREMNSGLYIVCRAEDELGERRLTRAGVDRLISSRRVAARKLTDGLLRPFVTDFFEGAGTEGSSGWKVEEIRIPNKSRICGKTLGDLSLRQTAKVSVAAIVSPLGKLELNPSGDTILQSGSTLIAIGWKQDIATLESLVGE